MRESQNGWCASGTPAYYFSSFNEAGSGNKQVLYVDVLSEVSVMVFNVPWYPDA